ncbi:MAG: cation-efflux pump [Anaerolineae bacterium]|nr:cation-efflux pump [Anaerolineae bacterium]
MQQATNRAQVRRVLTITLVLNLTVAISKIIIGLVSGALAITADGLHSIIDGSGNIVGLIAVRLADRPPDEDHPYGHSRFETLAALTIGVLLLLTATEIIRGAIERLTGGEAPEITPLAFIVMTGTLLVNVFVSRYQIREGKRLESQVLLADAANTSADVFVTLSVIVSMGLVAWLGWEWARSRGAASAAHIDVDVQVAPEMTANQSAAIADAIRDKLQNSLPGIDEVEVHFAPQQRAEPDYLLTARARADALGLATHEVRLSDGPAGKVLEMHVEVPADQTLDAAHDQVSLLEQDVQTSLPDVVEVITHIEPALSQAERMQDDLLEDHAQALEREAMALLRAEHDDLDWHDLRVQPCQTGFSLSMHVTLPPQISVEAAHRVAESAETLLRNQMPELERVMIHTEPPEKVFS